MGEGRDTVAVEKELAFGSTGYCWSEYTDGRLFPEDLGSSARMGNADGMDVWNRKGKQLECL